MRYSIDDLLADHLDQLGAVVRPVQPGGHQDHDLVARNAGRFERFQHRRQQQLVRHRPRDVANDDAGVAPPAGQLGQRRRAVGLSQHLPQCAIGIGQRRGILVGQACRTTRSAGSSTCQPRATVFKAYAHDD